MSGKRGAVQHRWTDAERARLAEIARGRTHDEIRAIMTEEFGDHFGGHRITAALKRYGIKTGLTGRFERGHDGGWKNPEHLAAFLEAGKATRFKKGEIHGMALHHMKPIGFERVDKDGYVEVKVADGLQGKPNCNYMHKHRYVFEQHHGPVPKGFNVVFADGDKRNFDPSNLVAVPRSAMATINSRGMKYHDAESLEACVRVAELEGAISRAQKSPRPCRRCGETFAPRFANQKTCDSCLGR